MRDTPLHTTEKTETQTKNPDETLKDLQKPLPKHSPVLALTKKRGKSEEITHPLLHGMGKHFERGSEMKYINGDVESIEKRVAQFIAEETGGDADEILEEVKGMPMPNLEELNDEIDP